MTDEQHASLMKHYNLKLTQMASYIDAQAIQILRRLKEADFEAYLVGGGVRDLLVNLKPKDFDIATNALPNEVKRKVPYSFIIGRRFKLVHAKRGDLIYEIATYRRAATTEELETTEQDERHLVEENFFGNIEEDSFRRDFTVNSLYYDPIDHVIVDHCRGLADIHDRVLRMIGDPRTRLLEDPVRILRAIRLSQKLHFSIEPNLRQQLFLLKDELKRTAPPRRREEWIKFFRLAKPGLALMELYDLHVFEMLMPSFHKLFSDNHKREEFLTLLRQLPEIGFDFSDTVELFSGVLMAYILVTDFKNLKVMELSENEEFLLFCRDELGVFKAEMGSFFQALQFMSALKNISSFIKKGERRQRSLLLHQSFDLALKLGLLTHQISNSEFIFWTEAKTNALSLPG